ncbi:MAG TPA: prepilin-type N-terminal cleavage/methylation domain-containing protein, partial [Candidatus Acidoferrales bacterium]|nr:prepilin-type N-terminal cleavage/methylation domain-containing protein [Candidatus Acidoferrales bacterium]
MKVLPAISAADQPTSAARAFTLPELLIAVTIFLLMVAGLLAANLFGLRIFQMSTTKLNATQWSRETLMRITDEIHSCDSAQVGVVSNGVFSAFLDGESEAGNGLFINPTSDTNSYILYFVDTDDQTFRRTTDQPNSTLILASDVTNTVAFAAEDFLGNVLTNSSNSQVIHLTLQIYQPGLFLQDADFYQLET